MRHSVADNLQSTLTMHAAMVAAGGAVATIVLLGSLHVLSPEFSPSWRVVSEYADGRYGWVLSLMFTAWAISTWALAVSLWRHVPTRAGKAGLWLLLVSGAGEAMAAVFNINHPLHNVAGLLGVPTMPIASLLLTFSLGRTQPWLRMRKLLLWISSLIGTSLLLLIFSLVVLVATFHHSGVQPDTHLTQLPAGVIGLDGWADRLFIITSCAWLMAMAGPALRTQSATKPGSEKSAVAALMPSQLR